VTDKTDEVGGASDIGIPLHSGRGMNGRLDGKVALVTGAGSGIGQAIALSLWSHGVQVCLVGRTRRKLEATSTLTGKDSTRIAIWPSDLTEMKDIARIKANLVRRFGRLDILVHSAGVIYVGRLESARPKEFDAQYRANMLAPFCLTRALLPLLKTAYGQIVFLNSTAGLTAPRDCGQFAATQFGLKAMADSLRLEVNPLGIRVLSVHPGRTATPRQARLCEIRQEDYKPELLLQPMDVADILVSAISLPHTAEVTEIRIRPSIKSY
jgi:NADP-dependent 3-hydroxy acid dehydrogenase YdfG